MKQITYNIPGGLFGNDPGAFEYDDKVGNVCVSADKIAEAIMWLRKRACICATGCHPDEAQTIIISYKLKR
jgi:hypothetical protein